MKVSDIKPAEYNPRKITDKQLEMLKKSMLEFGDLSGFVVNTKTGNLVGGHQRLKCMPENAIIEKVKLKKKSKTGTITEGYIIVDGERWNYREVEWDVTKEKAANIAANKHGGTFEDKLVAELISELQDSKFDIDLTGFDSCEIDKLLKEFDTSDENKDESDENTEGSTNVEVITKTGDIVELGNHRLLCGDATNAGDIEKLMNGKKPNMVFTDPPYDMDKDTLISAYNTVSKFSPAVQFWMGSDRQQVWLTSNDINNFSQFFIHDYKAATLVSNNIPMTQHNLISKFGKRKLNNLQDGFSTILRVSTLRGSIEHKNFTMGKRPELPFEFIIHYSNRGDIVLDVFGGSGSTLVAAQKAGRVCYMIEKSQKQCDMIVERYKKYTGEKVVRSCK